jgi:hypothetical protein
MNFAYFRRRSLSVLNEADQQTELKLEQEQFNVTLYKTDLDFCRENKMNISRIIRLEFHKWLSKERLTDESTV